MSLFLDRSSPERPHLEWKVRIFLAGAVLGVAGIYLDERWLTGAGIAVLLAGVLLRFLPGGAAERREGGDAAER